MLKPDSINPIFPDHSDLGGVHHVATMEKQSEISASINNDHELESALIECLRIFARRGRELRMQATDADLSGSVNGGESDQPFIMTNMTDTSEDTR
jgi:hypothetical protein